jgi:hypothetical protein
MGMGLSIAAADAVPWGMLLLSASLHNSRFPLVGRRVQSRPTTIRWRGGCTRIYRLGAQVQFLCVFLHADLS